MYNNRVLMYNSIPTADSASADVVIGQQNMTSNAVNQGGSVGGNTLCHPSSVFTDTVKILVCDRYNNRVLIFNNPPSANNTAADLVIGQPNLASNTANSGGVSAKSLYYPRIGWSGSGILFISDYMNNRVLRYNIVPSSNYALADIVIGQPNMTSNAANNY
jgi:hypothetical protein